MKTFFLLLAVCFSALAHAQQASPLPASQVIKEAGIQASKEKKKVFIIFHASWCGWCHRMDTAMNDAVCKKSFDDNYVIRHITVQESPNNKALENPGGADLLKNYHGDEQGIPFWLVLDDHGKLLADSRMAAADGQLKNVGCPSEKEEVDYFITVLQKTSRLGASALDAIRARFARR
ncbi:thioredoxin family protein [Chitinophaga vietnamensis]|uniref:thioredoxin family protein n=1 Tax=Chitinophaga vietnamensis TaxID=2593957 RepID=UPI001177399D|nr:thioredoxin family protein [Chitinophaga vietnamensis]